MGARQLVHAAAATGLMSRCSLARACTAKAELIAIFKLLAFKKFSSESLQGHGAAGSAHRAHSSLLSFSRSRMTLPTLYCWLGSCAQMYTQPAAAGQSKARMRMAERVVRQRRYQQRIRRRG